MLTRVTTQMTMAAAQRNLQAGSARVATLQDQASSLKNISKPSDDPAGTGSAMAVRSRQAATAQYTRNTQDATGWLATTDSTLADVSDLVNKVRDLTVQGANSGALAPSAREAIAAQISSLKSDLLQTANTRYAGRAVFAGDAVDGVAVAADGTPTPIAASTTRRIADGTAVRVDTDGSAVFGSGTGSVFTLLDGIAADLRNGVDVAPRLTQIDARLTAVQAAQGDVGSRHAQVLRAQSSLATTASTLEAQRSGIEDRDIAKSVLDLQLAQTNYQAALAVTAKVIRPTLMDYLS